MMRKKIMLVKNWKSKFSFFLAFDFTCKWFYTEEKSGLRWISFDEQIG